MFKNLVSLIKKRVGISEEKTDSFSFQYTNNELKTRQFNFKITPTLYEKLSKTSEKIGRSKSEIVNCAIYEFLEKI